MNTEDRLAALETRLRELEDDRQIRELLSRYGYFADMGMDEAYLNLYTDDGAIEVGSVMRDGKGYNGVVRFEGRDQLRKFITDPAAHKAIQGRCMHVQGNNVRTHIKGDEATAESYSIVLYREGDETYIRSSGFNRWILRRERGAWKIKERVRKAIGGEDYDKVLISQS